MKYKVRLTPTTSANRLQSVKKVLVIPEFTREINRLSYRQLIRISSMVDAENEAESKEAKRITHSLTPVERKIVNNIIGCKNTDVKRVKRQLIQTRLREKNVADTKNIDAKLLVDALLKNE